MATDCAATAASFVKSRTHWEERTEVQSPLSSLPTESFGRLKMNTHPAKPRSWAEEEFSRVLEVSRNKAWLSASLEEFPYGSKDWPRTFVTVQLALNEEFNVMPTPESGTASTAATGKLADALGCW